MTDISNYNSIREDAHRFYKSIGRIPCPAFNNENVHFTSEGFNHLIYKNSRRERDKSVQIMKFKLLSRAKLIVERLSLYQEYDEGLITIKKKKKRKTHEITTTVRYWGLVAIIQNHRVKVIIRQVGNGQKHFWSVIPAWTKSHYRDTRLILQSKGNLTDD